MKKIDIKSALSPKKLLKNIYFQAFIILIIFIIVRLPELGFSNFNTDSFKWKARIYDFGSGVFNLNFETTVQKYHPGVTLLWIGTFSVKLFNLINENYNSLKLLENTPEFIFTLNFYQIFWVVLFCGLLSSILFIFLSKILDNAKSFIIVLIITTEPFLLGLTTTLHLDGILNLLILNVVVCFFLFLKQSNIKYLYLLSFFFGLSLLTKTTALLVLPLIIFGFYLQNSSFKTKLSYISKVILITFGTYFILWPGMWIDPIGTLTYVYKGITVGTDDHSQIFLGQEVLDPGPLYYIYVIFLKSPVYQIPSLIFILGSFFYKIFKKESYSLKLRDLKEKYLSDFSFFLLISGFIYFIEISIPSKKLDRYVVTSMILFSLGALVWFLRKHFRLLIVFLIINFVMIVYLRGDYFSYFNPVFGGTSTGISTLESKWIFGQKEIQAYFIREKELYFYDSFSEGENIDKISKNHNKLVVALPEKYYTQLFPYFRLIGAWGVINELKFDAVKANYFIFPVWDNQVKDFELRYNLGEVLPIYVNNIEVFKVYKVKN
jgi:hypothetical protein